MARFRITLEYDGSAFQGWQIQPDVRSVQQVVEQALAEVVGDVFRVHVAGRTDAGVHARGQAAHFDSATRLSPHDLYRALNAVFPEDVAVRELRHVCAGFDARRDAIQKRYLYRILQGGHASPLRRGHCWQVRQRLDLSAMRAAAALLCGTHEFGAFRGAHGGPPAGQESRRTLDRLCVMRRRDEIHVVAEARSFLRYMVRNLVGTLAEVGRGRCTLEQVARMLDSGDRSAAGPTAPPHGLCLEWVRYPR